MIVFDAEQQLADREHEHDQSIKSLHVEHRSELHRLMEDHKQSLASTRRQLAEQYRQSVDALQLQHQQQHQQQMAATTTACDKRTANAVTECKEECDKQYLQALQHAREGHDQVLTAALEEAERRAYAQTREEVQQLQQQLQQASESHSSCALMMVLSIRSRHHHRHLHIAFTRLRLHATFIAVRHAVVVGAVRRVVWASIRVSVAYHFRLWCEQHRYQLHVQRALIGLATSFARRGRRDALTLWRNNTIVYQVC